MSMLNIYRCQWGRCDHQRCKQQWGWRWQWWRDGGQLGARRILCRIGEKTHPGQGSQCWQCWQKWYNLKIKSATKTWVKIDCAVRLFQEWPIVSKWLQETISPPKEPNHMQWLVALARPTHLFWWQTLLNSVIETTPYFVQLGPKSIWFSF